MVCSVVVCSVYNFAAANDPPNHKFVFLNGARLFEHSAVNVFELLNRFKVSDERLRAVPDSFGMHRDQNCDIDEIPCWNNP
jgi:hypothetical protein